MPAREQTTFDWAPPAGPRTEERPPPAKGSAPKARPRAPIQQQPAGSGAEQPAARARPARATDVRWLTADEAAAHLGFPSRKALYAAVERGQVPAHRLGRRRLRFKLDDLDALPGRLPGSAGVR